MYPIELVFLNVLNLKVKIQLISISLVDCASTSTCLNIPQPVQLSRLGLNRPQPMLLVQPGPQPVQLVEVKVESVK